MWTKQSRGRMVQIARKTRRSPCDQTDEEWERIALYPNLEPGAASSARAAVAWPSSARASGMKAALRARVAAHWQAGADHVCVQAVAPDGSMLRPDERALAALAPVAAAQKGA